MRFAAAAFILSRVSCAETGGAKELGQEDAQSSRVREAFFLELFGVETECLIYVVETLIQSPRNATDGKAHALRRFSRRARPQTAKAAKRSPAAC